MDVHLQLLCGCSLLLHLLQLSLDLSDQDILILGHLLALRKAGGSWLAALRTALLQGILISRVNGQADSSSFLSTIRLLRKFCHFMLCLSSRAYVLRRMESRKPQGAWKV